MAAQDLRLYDSTPAEVPSLAAVGTIPGLQILAAAGLNGPGVGHLNGPSGEEDPTWQPPGEEYAGGSVTCPTDGTYILTFGDKWLEVAVLYDWLDAGGAGAPVFLQDLWNNGLASDDVTAAEALSGDVETYSLNWKNVGTSTLPAFTVWLDAETEFLEISADNATWNSGITQATGVAFGTLAAGATVPIYFRRTIPASTEAYPYVRNHLHVATDYMMFSFRGMYRVFNAAIYSFYRSDGTVPILADTPYATSATLPATPATTFTDGDWRLSVAWSNGVLSSGFYPVGENAETYLRLIVASGVVSGQPPAGPASVQLVALSGGVVQIQATYREDGTYRAEEWAIAYTINGVDPVEDTPTLTPAIDSAGVVVLEYSLPAQSHGTTVKVRLQTRRDDAVATEEDPEPTPILVYSEDSTVETATAVVTGPTAPLAVAEYRGELPQGA